MLNVDDRHDDEQGDRSPHHHELRTEPGLQVHHGEQKARNGLY